MSGTEHSEATGKNDGYQVVQLGPKETKVPEEWNVSPLEEISTQFITGGTPDTDTETYWNGNIPWTTAAVIEGPCFSGCKKYISEEGLSNSSARLVPSGGLLFGTRVNVANIGKTEQDIAISQDITGILPDEHVIDSDYLTWYLLDQQDRIRAQFSQGSTIQGMIIDDLKSISVLMPSLAEQRRIAAVLSTVNRKIKQTEKIVGTAEELKRGLEQDLVLGKGLSDEYQDVQIGPRNVTLPSDWHLSTFSKIATIEKGSTPKTSNEAYYGGDIVWVTPDDLSTLYEKGEKYIDDSRRKLTEAGLESISAHIVEPDSVMFTSRSYGIGKTAICTVPAATNQGIIAFEPNPEMNPEYLYHYLNWIMDYIVSLSGVSTFPEVSKNDISTIAMPVPPEDHQEQIAEVLKQADEKIFRERQHKLTLQELKRGLMQDLLTGKVRVNDLPLESN